MRTMFKATFYAATMAAMVCATAVNAADERRSYGWGGSGGGNLTMFSKNHDNPLARAGELSFVFGGSATTEGDVTFLNYNGAAWNELMSLDQAGTLRIGAQRTTTCGGCKLAVNGSVMATEVVVATQASWPDYVFDASYNLKPLEEVEAYIKENGYLPDVPSASQVAAEGINIGDMNATLLRKIEELTLYVIDLKKENAELRQSLNHVAEAVSR